MALPAALVILGIIANVVGRVLTSGMLWLSFMRADMYSAAIWVGVYERTVGSFLNFIGLIAIIVGIALYLNRRKKNK
ncbi:MAG: LPXTG cell wall anchor domain-containing protein [Promethearchaeota archaeon]